LRNLLRQSNALLVARSNFFLNLLMGLKLRNSFDKFLFIQYAKLYPGIFLKVQVRQVYNFAMYPLIFKNI
jgi:hypothetical protein